MFTNRKLLPVVFIALLLPMQVRAWWNPVGLFKKSPRVTTFLGVATAIAAGFMLCKSLLSSDQTGDEKDQQSRDLEFKATKEDADTNNDKFAVSQNKLWGKMSLDPTNNDKTESSTSPRFELFQKALAQKNSKPTIVGKSKDLTSKNRQTMKLFVVNKGGEFKYCVAFPAKRPTEKKRWDITMYDSIFGAVAKVLVNLKFSSEQEKSAFKKELIKFYKDNSNIEKLIK